MSGCRIGPGDVPGTTPWPHHRENRLGRTVKADPNGVRRDESIGPPPPFDPELEEALVEIRDSLPPSVVPDDIPTLRRSMAALDGSDDDLQRNGSVELFERVVPGPEGAPDVALLVCRPREAAGVLPAIYHIHGGGMVAGSNRSGLLGFVVWIERLPMVIVSVEYRLAPEHPFPAQVEDSYAGLLWTAEHASELGIDPARLIVAGASAGGCLAAAVALLARDRGGPTLHGQLLQCPMLDDHNDTASTIQMSGLGIWDRTASDTAWRALLAGHWGKEDVSPYAAPARATDLRNLPPAFIDVGSAETFRDEAVQYASRIWRAGGRAELHVWPGAFHGSDGIVPRATVSRAARQTRFRWLERLIGSSATIGT
jgi:acetyl esterase/lipase